MIIEVFKTNVTLKKQASALLKQLTEQYPLFKINFDLQDCDRILRVEGRDVCADAIQRLLQHHGYQCQALE